jgi:hypothetical protein
MFVCGPLGAIGNTIFKLPLISILMRWPSPNADTTGLVMIAGDEAVPDESIFLPQPARSIDAAMTITVVGIFIRHLAAEQIMGVGFEASHFSYFPPYLNPSALSRRFYNANRLSDKSSKRCT